VQEYTYVYNREIKGPLDYTPGFDDTNKSNSEILRDLGNWVVRSYPADVKLSGILYLHRITISAK
jgi:hypothetical protein